MVHQHQLPQVRFPLPSPPFPCQLSESSCRPKETTINFNQLISAIRSQLHFSQISAWLATDANRKLTGRNLQYRLTMPGETYEASKFTSRAAQHNFPVADIGNGFVVNVTYLSASRTAAAPTVRCPRCDRAPKIEDEILDDRMHTSCTLKGKHRCEDVEEFETGRRPTPSTSKPRLNLNIEKVNDLLAQRRRLTPRNYKNYLNDLDGKGKNNGQLLLEAILRSGQKSTNGSEASANKSGSDSPCDKSESDISNIKRSSSNNCDSQKCKETSRSARQKLTFEDDDAKRNGTAESSSSIPSALEQAKFRKNLDSAASMVFHSRTGLPLTSSPAPVRRGKSCFDFDSSINSVSAIRR